MTSRFPEQSILEFKTKTMSYRRKDDVLKRYFTKQDNFSLCKNVKDLLTAIGIPLYKADFHLNVHVIPPFRSKRVVLLFFGPDIRTRLGVAISEVPLDLYHLVFRLI